MARLLAQRSLSLISLLAAAIVISVALAPATHAQTESVLYKFTKGLDGSNPLGNLAFDSAGNLYGAANGGPASGTNAIFRLSPTSSGWKESVLHIFDGGKDGYTLGGVLLDSAGNVYGTTITGGYLAGCSGNGCGTVYKLSPNSKGGWIKSALYAFTGKQDSENPTSTLILDVGGNLYGTTSHGGNLDYCDSYDCGVVFQISPTSSGEWKQSVLHVFTGSGDGGRPNDGLAFDAAGNLYGTTEFGGAYGYGTVYRLSPSASGWTETVLYSFNGNGFEGGFPYSGPILDAAGNIYGITIGGGNGYGKLYELTPDGAQWAQNVLYSFTSGDTLANPQLKFDALGNVWATTETGGTGKGTVLKFSPPTWTETVIYNLPGGPDGKYPLGGVIFDAAGNIYGTAYEGGVDELYGLVFELKP